MEEPQPGQTISPQSAEPDQPEVPADNAVAEATKTAEPTSQWKFQPEDADSLEQPSAKQNKIPVDTVSWSASEFVAHQKSTAWYLGLVVAAIAVASVVFLLTRDKISTGVVLFAAFVLGFFAARKPRTLDYKLDEAGLSIGQKFYEYDLFKSFAVMEEGAFSSILLLPLKRFMPSLSLYYELQDEHKIVDILASRLAFEDRKRDAVDSFMHRIRF